MRNKREGKVKQREEKVRKEEGEARDRKEK